MFYKRRRKISIEIVFVVVGAIASAFVGYRVDFFYYLHNAVHAKNIYLEVAILVGLIVFFIGMIVLVCRRLWETQVIVKELEEVQLQLRSREKSLKLYKEIYRVIPHGIHIYQLTQLDDPESLLLIDANPATDSLTGVPVQKILNRKILENFSDLPASLIERYSAVARDGGEDIIGDFCYKDERVDGWYSVRIFGLPDHSMGVIFLNITEQKRMESELRASEIKWKQLVNSMTEGMAWHVLEEDSDGKENYRIRWVNDSFVPILGLQKEVVEGRFSTEAYNVSEAPFIEIYKEVARTGVPKVFEEYFDQMNKTLIISVFRPGDNSQEFVTVFFDITALRQAQEAVKESESLYRLLFHSGMDVIFLHGLKADGMPSNFLEVNNKACEMLGYTREDFLRFTPKKIINFDGQSRLPEVTKRLYTEGDILFEVTFVDSNDQEIPVEIHAHMFKMGKKYMVLSIARDIRERIRTNELLRFQDRMELVEQLAGGVAHDFNNLLGGILGFIDLALRFDDVKAIRNYLRKALSSYERAKDLTQQLLSFAKGLEIRTSKMDINSIVEQAASFAIRGQSTHCKFDIQETLSVCDVDVGKLHQVIMNLVLNAHQAMEEGSTVYVGVENVEKFDTRIIPLAPGPKVCISIRDTGIGIPADKLGKVFDPYYTTKKDGNGIGLSTSFGIIRQHNGYITVESEVGVGTTFYIYLPAILDYTVKPEEQVESGKLKKPQFGLKILFMDDEEILCDIVNDFFNILGCKCTVVSNGEKAIETYLEAKLVDESFDLVVLDLTIRGGMGGRETILRLIEYDPEIVAFVSSGWDEGQGILQSPGEFGFKGSIGKPFLLQNLISLMLEHFDPKS